MLNAGGDNHSYATRFSGQTKGTATIPAGTYIGFEDLPASSSDFNYTDEQFILADTSVTTLSPEPNSIMSIGLGILCVGIGSLRKTRSRRN